MESQARLEAAGLAKRMLEEARENAEREAREIITTSIQRVMRDYVNEATISVVPIANDAMKGRIIGREGRNIRAIEAATGIDLIIDETPEAVIISGFDPLRREIAKVSLERLMHDGRIHPTRIEEIVEKVKIDIEKLMYEEAEKIIFELGLSDFHPELIKVLGGSSIEPVMGRTISIMLEKPRTFAASWRRSLASMSSSRGGAPCCMTSGRPSVTKKRARMPCWARRSPRSTAKVRRS